jgi:hypothetical protein
MTNISYKRHRFPPEIIQHAVWLYFRFTFSFRDVEDLLAERGLDISYESIRYWVLKSGNNMLVVSIKEGHVQIAGDNAVWGVCLNQRQVGVFVVSGWWWRRGSGSAGSITQKQESRAKTDTQIAEETGLSAIYNCNR